jgi:hypothetical protein
VCHPHGIEDARQAGGWSIQIDVPIEIHQTQVNTVAQETCDDAQCDRTIAADDRGDFLPSQNGLNLVSRACSDVNDTSEVLLFRVCLIRPKSNHWQISVIDNESA